MKAVVAFVCGVLFAVGLGVSGMTDPSKVIGFLDFFGDWDPSLALVMVGAIGTAWLPTWVSSRRAAPVLDSRYHLATSTRVDARLLGGAALFGVGWGLAGYCPGPALVAAGVAVPQALVFTIAMAAGMLLWQRVATTLDSPAPVAPVPVPVLATELADG